MPIVGGKYKNPGWVNNQKPAIGATELNAISATVEKLDAGGGDAVTSFKGRTGAVTPQAGDYTAEMVGARPSTWTPSAADINAVPTSRTVNGMALSSDINLNASDVNAVPASRTVNGKALSSDITLTAADLGTAPITYGTTDLTAGSSSLATGSVYLVYE